jgi:hypothetical protein
LNATQSNLDVDGGYGGVERRAAPRRRFRQPVEVRLSGGDGDRPWTCAGVMLDATIRGIACRIAESDAARIPPDDRLLGVAFDLADGSAAFAMKGVIRSVTAAGTPEHLVLGIEFTFGSGNGEEKSRLREALDALPAKGGLKQAR